MWPSKSKDTQIQNEIKQKRSVCGVDDYHLTWGPPFYFFQKNVRDGRALSIWIHHQRINRQLGIFSYFCRSNSNWKEPSALVYRKECSIDVNISRLFPQHTTTNELALFCYFGFFLFEWEFFAHLLISWSCNRCRKKNKKNKNKITGVLTLRSSNETVHVRHGQRWRRWGTHMSATYIYI